MAVEASIVINFTEDADTTAKINIEIDPLNSLNQGGLDDDGKVTVKSSFEVGPPADTPVIILNYSSTVVPVDVAPSVGNATFIGAAIVNPQTREENFELLNTKDSASSSYAEVSNPSFVYAGGFSGATTWNPTKQKLTLDPPGATPAIGVMTLDVPFNQSVLLTPPSNLADLLDDDGNYEIIVVVTFGPSS